VNHLQYFVILVYYFSLRMSRECEFLVIGGGIAGVSCAESLAICRPTASILLLTESSIVKSVTNLVPVARYLHKFDVRERDVSEMGAIIETLVDQLDHINSKEHWIRTIKGVVIKYRYLCLCTGGVPKLFCGQVLDPCAFHKLQ